MTKVGRARAVRVIAAGGLAMLFQRAAILFDACQNDLNMHGLAVVNAYNKE